MATHEVSDTVSFPPNIHRLNSHDLQLLASSNTAPDEAQRLSLEQALVRRTSDVGILYQTLKDCKRLHLKTQRELIAAEGDIRSIKTVTHPVRVMPPELLKEIFAFGRKGSFNACVSTTDNVWRWAQVCRQWRYVCLTTPSLWSDIRLKLDTAPSGRHARRILDTCMSQSRNCHLDVSILAPGLNIEDNPLIEPVLLKCERWRSLVMDAPVDTWHSLDVCIGSLSELEVLAITDTSFATRSPSSPVPVISSFMFVPSLQTLSISQIPLRSLTLPPTVYPGLKEFDVHLYGQASTVFDTLPRMNSIRCLDLTCDAAVDDFEAVIRLPSVTSLTLRDGATSGSLPAIWAMLRLDNLRKLSLYYESNIHPPVLPHLSSPVQSITSFKLCYEEFLNGFYRHDEASVVLLHQLPSVEKLDITFPSFCTHLCTELRTNSKFLPRLSDIKLICWDLQDDAEVACIADMLRARRSSLECATITKLTLHRSDPLSIHDPITPGWESLLKTGLIVSFA